MKPSWIKKQLHVDEKSHDIKKMLRQASLHTVCEEARCPNQGECFSRGTATFMILGDVCTRRCGFCGVKSVLDGAKIVSPDKEEPLKIAQMAEGLGLKHTVVTSVTRDDLPDEGASQFALTISALRNNLKSSTIEVLTPDFHAREECMAVVCAAGPDVFNHNIETVSRLVSKVRYNADYQRSLNVLRWVREHYSNIKVKSGLMLGLGETYDEVVELLKDLHDAGCEIITIGQYLKPAKGKLEVVDYVTPELFEEYKVIGERLGVNHMFCGPFVRSSYMAEKCFAKREN